MSHGPDGVHPPSADNVEDHTLDTTHSIRSSVLSGAKWASAASVGAQLIQFGAGLVLARLLTPEDFGLAASAWVITGFSVLLFELGLGASLIQLRDPDETDLSTVFWLNLISGVVFASLLTVTAPLVADFYGQPALVTLTPLLALPFALSIGVVHSALLTRRLDLRRVAIIELFAAGAGNLVGVIAAFRGAGVYSLALTGIVNALLLSALFMMSVRWRPRSFISRQAVRRLWRFSGGMLAFNVLSYWSRNTDNLLVGRVFGPVELGIYNRAYNLMLLPVYQFNGAIGRVMFPALSAIQSDLERVSTVYVRTLKLVNAVSVPVLIGLMVTAPAFVPLLWGPQWEGVVGPLQVLCFAGLPQCALTSVGWILQSQGRMKLQFKIGLTVTVFGVAMIALALHWGLTAVAWAIAVRYWVELPAVLAIVERLLKLPLGRIARSSLSVLACGAFMGACVWLVPVLTGLDRTKPTALAVQIVAGLLLYTASVRVVDKVLWDDIRSIAPRQRLKGHS